MPRYIIRSRALRASAAVSLSVARLSAEHRAGQRRAILERRLEDPVDKELRRWLTGAGSQVERVTASEERTAVTSTTIADMAPEEAARLVREVPGIVVLRDERIDLIRPTERTVSVIAAEQPPWHLSAIGLQAARQAGFRGDGHGVTVAVLDTGIDDSHPEIAGRVTGTFTFDVATWQARQETGSRDTHGHGTHVSGILAGKNVGVAPGANLLNGIMLPGAYGRLSDFVLAIEWVASRPDVGVLNMSAGIPGFVDGMAASISDLLAAGVLPVIATGNEGFNSTRSPGNYEAPLTVGAATKDGVIASFSSSARMTVNNHIYNVPDVVAPGERIRSCVRGGGYEEWSGTSMATPIVSGIAALVLQAYPNISVVDLIDEIRSACRKLPAPAERQGVGLVQVPPRLLSSATPTPVAPTPVAPSPIAPSPIAPSPMTPQRPPRPNRRRIVLAPRRRPRP